MHSEISSQPSSSYSIPESARSLLSCLRSQLVDGHGHSFIRECL